MLYSSLNTFVLKLNHYFSIFLINLTQLFVFQYLLFPALLAITRAGHVYHVPAEVMQRIKYIQNHNHQVLNQYQQQQQHEQGFEQQSYNNELTNQGHQQELNHQFQNHQLQNYLLGPQEIQTAPLSLHQIQAPQLQHQIQEQIAPQIQPQSYDHHISVPLQPPVHQELQVHKVKVKQIQLPQTQVINLNQIIKFLLIKVINQIKFNSFTKTFTKA